MAKFTYEILVKTENGQISVVNPPAGTEPFKNKIEASVAALAHGKKFGIGRSLAIRVRKVRGS